MRKRRKPPEPVRPSPMQGETKDDPEETTSSETEAEEPEEVEPEQIMGNVPVQEPDLDPRLLEPVEHDAPPMTAVPAEGARVGFISCEICGAAILIDPRDMVDVPALHADWHRKES